MTELIIMTRIEDPEEMEKLVRSSESETPSEQKEPHFATYVMNIVSSEIGLGILTIPYLFK